MITYKIEGIPSTFKSKPVNLDRDVIKILRSHGLPTFTPITILQHDDNPELLADSAVASRAGELTSLPESAESAQCADVTEPGDQASDLQPVHDDVDESCVSSSDESVPDWNDDLNELK